VAAPAPFLLGSWGVSTNSPAAYAVGHAAVMAKLATGVAMTVPQQQAAFDAAIAEFVALPNTVWLIPPGYHYTGLPAYQAAYAALIKALSGGTRMTMVQQEAFLDTAVAAYDGVPTASANLAWQNVVGSTGVNVYQGPSPSALVKVATLAAGVSSWKSPPLTAGVYYFTLTNLSPAESEMSPTISAQISPGAAPPVSVPSFVGITVTLT
jgi:hypothetical protein